MWSKIVQGNNTTNNTNNTIKNSTNIRPQTNNTPNIIQNTSKEIENEIKGNFFILFSSFLF